MSEDKKLNELLREVWDSLTDEQKEKAKACKTTDEFLKLAGDEGIELPDELLDAISGGVIVDIKDGTWSAFDSDGVFIGNVWSKAKAEELAKQKGASTAETNYSGLQKIRYEAQKRKSSC